jgi:ATP/maltotriose-dependent transcriptional regulator MalT
MLVRMKIWLPTMALVTLAACGSSGPQMQTAVPELREIQPKSFLREYGAEQTALLKPSQKSIEALQKKVQKSRRGGRIQAMRALTIALMSESIRTRDTGEPRKARRLARRAMRMARRVRRAARDAQIDAEMAFVPVWIAWQHGRSNTTKLARRFTKRHGRSGVLHLLAWVIRGEAAFEQEKWRNAKTAYRYLLGLVDHPLYPYALMRTAHCERAQGDKDKANKTLREVVQLGCRGELTKHESIVVEAAASQTGIAMVTSPDGTKKPASCGGAPGGSESGASPTG